jgi:hypothetical protein
MTSDLYSSPESRLDTVMADPIFWTRLRQASIDYKKNVGKEQLDENFDQWLALHWGVQLYRSHNEPDGGLTGFDVLDEKLYLLFLLKYS